MPAKSTSYTDEQYAYIVRTAENGFSERVQELIEKGREVEEE